MWNKLNKIKERYAILNKELSDPDIFKNQSKFQQLSKEQSEIGEIVEKYDK